SDRARRARGGAGVGRNEGSDRATRRRAGRAGGRAVARGGAAAAALGLRRLRLLLAGLAARDAAERADQTDEGPAVRAGVTLRRPLLVATRAAHHPVVLFQYRLLGLVHKDLRGRGRTPLNLSAEAQHCIATKPSSGIMVSPHFICTTRHVHLVL